MRLTIAGLLLEHRVLDLVPVHVLGGLPHVVQAGLLQLGPGHSRGSQSGAGFRSGWNETTILNLFY